MLLRFYTPPLKGGALGVAHWARCPVRIPSSTDGEAFNGPFETAVAAVTLLEHSEQSAYGAVIAAVQRNAKLGKPARFARRHPVDLQLRV
jgi:hypothetical protein